MADKLSELKLHRPGDSTGEPYPARVSVRMSPDSPRIYAEAEGFQGEKATHQIRFIDGEFVLEKL